MSPRRSSRRSLSFLLLVAALGLAVACSGGGGGGSAVAVNTGSVGVLITDAPVDPDLFSSIRITFTDIILIGEGGQTPLFSGRETIDLRDFEDVGKLVALGRGVRVGTFQKIRMLLEDIELVPADGGASIHPKLPPKLDLNPQGTVEVRPGELLLVQIDFDAGNSLHINEKGNGSFGFRPVVLAKILGLLIPGKLVLLEGEVEELDLASDHFLLCRSGHAVSKPKDDDDDIDDEQDGDRDERVMDDEEDGDRDDFCTKVFAQEASVFDENGDPADLDVLMNGDEASVLGRFVAKEDHDEADEALVFLAEVIQAGTPEAIDGEVLSEVDPDGRFEVGVDPGQGFGPSVLFPVQLQTGTKIFSRRGEPLDESNIEVGTPVRAVGVLEDGVLKASVVTLDIETVTLEKISGEITDVRLGGAELDVDTDEGVRCVELPEDATIFAVEIEGNDAVAKPIDRSELAVGDDVNVVGVPNGCLVAEKLIAFRDLDDD